MTHTLESLVASGFAVEVKNEARLLDLKPRWYVSAFCTAREDRGPGLKTSSIGKNEFVGAGDSIEGAITSLIRNVNEMANRLNGAHAG